jgi:hypothetical protein
MNHWTKLTFAFTPVRVYLSFHENGGTLSKHVEAVYRNVQILIQESPHNVMTKEALVSNACGLVEGGWAQ